MAYRTEYEQIVTAARRAAVDPTPPREFPGWAIGLIVAVVIIATAALPYFGSW